MNPLSLNELLRWRALNQPDQLAYTFLLDGETEELKLTYKELDSQARAVARWLRSVVADGERVLLLYPPGLEYLSAFFGCLYARAVPVPIYPPRRNQNLRRIQAIVADAQPTVALTTSRIKARIEPLCAEVSYLKTLCWLASEEATYADDESWEGPEVCGDDLAFFQYTSGSTGTPKGVMLTQRNLLRNAAIVYQAMEHTDTDKYVSWLPVFHDMGFMAGVLQPLYAGIPAILISPTSFLQRPVRWLEAISRYGATTSGAPNFAYDLCARRITAEQRASLDLTSWTGAFNGAEPIRPETIESFTAAFAPCGFRRESFYPCYGLAEATLIITGGRKSAPPVIGAFQASALENNLVCEAGEDDEGARRLVGCGRALPGQEVVIINPETLALCSPHEVGEIWASGASIAQGYWNRAEESERTFRAVPSGYDGTRFLRTGDLGFLKDGELFVTGRLKDLIIIRGLNHYPQDFELTVEQSHEALRPNACAAFSVEAGGEERLVVVQEVEPRQRFLQDEVFGAIRQAVATQHEVQLYAAALLKPGSLPKTSSGKIQRHECRRRFLSGELESVAEWRESGTSIVAVEQAVYTGSRAARREEIEHWLMRHVATHLGIEPTSIDADLPLARYGIDSLKAVELTHGIEEGLGVSLPMISFLQDFTLAQLATQVRELKAGASEAEPLLSAAEDTPDGEQPLSYGQRAMWFLHRLAPDSPAYNVAAPLKILGELDVVALQLAFQVLLDRHASLRTTFTMVRGEMAQRVRRQQELDFPVIDATNWDQTTVNEVLAEQTLRPFNLEEGPLLRVSLLKRSAREYILLMVAHHIIIDFWSLAVLMDELGVAYRAEKNGVAADLPPLALAYTDFARWQAETMVGPRGDQLRAFWERELAGELPVLNLPTDRPRPAAQTFSGSSRSITLSAELTEALKQLGYAHGATLYMTLLAAFQVWLHHHTGQKEFLVGSPTSGRGRRALERLVGYCVNPVALRADLLGNPAFAELIGRVRRRVLSVFEHQDYPLALLVERLQLERDLSQSPLFQVMFVLQKAKLHDEEGLASFAVAGAEARVQLGELLLESLRLEQQVSLFDLALTAAEADGGLALSLQYNKDLFDEATAVRMLERLRVLLEKIVADASRRVSDLEILTEAERRQVLSEWNETTAPYPTGVCVHHLFEAQVEKTPDAPALVSETESCTYADLNRRANHLAHYLLSLGVGPESRVAVCLERSVEMIVCYLAVLKAGGAYLSVDPAYPEQRVSFILEDSGACVLLTRDGPGGKSTSYAAHVVRVDAEWLHISRESVANPPHLTTPQNLAYVIYTSGSSGKPKGVELEHGGLVNLIVWHQRAYGVSAGDRATQLAAPIFDASVWELWPYLTAGASVHIVGDEVRTSAPLLMEWLADQAITICFSPTPLTEVILSEQMPAGLSALRLLLTGGDRLHRAPSKAHGFILVNHYGPTECTVVATSAIVVPDPGDGKPPSIGRPIANTQAYVLDARLRPVPPGSCGELYIGGAALARGYLNRPELTAERFIPNAYSSEGGERLYRTGDLVRHLADGNLEYVGRTDAQVKVRGFRIELGEIEAVLAEQSLVSQSAVVVRESGKGDLRLVAYVVCESGTDATRSVEELRARVRERLPQYMVPSAFVALDELPLTANGKVDRRALVARAEILPETEQDSSATRDQVTELLSGIWSEVLGAARVRLHDNFFEQGGHSLLATQLISRVREAFHVEIPLRNLFDAPTVAGLAAVVSEAMAAGQREQTPPLVPVLRDDVLPLSYAQQRLWFLDQLEPSSAFYNIAAAIRLNGQLDTLALERSVNEVVRRHEALRTTFEDADGEPVQLIAPASRLELPVVELSDLNAEEREQEVQRLACGEARRPFDLARGPLLRMSLLRLGEAEHVLLLTLHHIVSDGWSMKVFAQELAALYQAFSEGRPSPLPELTIQYADFAHWQRRLLEADVLRSEMAYWKEQLGGSPRLLELPTDHPRPVIQTHRGATLFVDFPPHLAESLKTFSRREGVTLFMTLLAAFKVLLYRYTGQTDISVGTPMAGRNQVEVEGLIGFFANTLVLRSEPSGDLTFRDFLRQVREVALGAYLRQNAPFEKLVEELQPERELSHSPLFQVMFVLQDVSAATLALPGLSVSLLDIHHDTAKFDLFLSMLESDGRFTCTLEYSTDLFEAATVGRLLEHFRTLLEVVAADPSRTLDTLPMLTWAERRQLLVEWNDTSTCYESESLLHEHFELQAARMPEAVALVFGAERLTYAELNGRANQLARHLRRLGVGPDVLVGLLVERSPEMLVALLGVLKAGGAYLPLDPDYPPERLAFMLADSAVPVLITQQRLAGRLPAHKAQVLQLDADWLRCVASESDAALAPLATSEQLAYTIYTSGSTGRPKGVQIPHRALVNFILYMRRQLALSEQDVWPAVTSLSFDIAALELYLPLIAGARLVLVSREVAMDAAALSTQLRECGATIMQATPATWRMLIEAGWEGQAGLKILCGGEALERGLARRLLARGGELWNLYGPTETTIWSLLSRVEDDAPRITIGRPLANTQAYVLDAQQQPVPLGVSGELYVGGDGLARGYLNRPELTSERFVPNPFSAAPGARLYRTGDLVRYLPGGEIEFLGRNDHQVKVRGYRIELGEIEEALRQHPGVLQAVVVARGGGETDTRLFAYLVADSERWPGHVELRRFLQEKLPAYMMPASFMRLDALPLTPNGKLDRKALPGPESSQGAAGEISVAARTPTEEVLAGIWAEVLRTERVGAEDNFFDLGGHSLLATRVIARMRAAFRVEPPLRLMFEQPTVRGLAAEIEKLRGEAQTTPEIPLAPVERVGNLPLSFGQQRLWFLDQMEPDNASYNLAAAVRLTGNRLDIATLERSFNEIVGRHEVLRTTFSESEGYPVVFVAPELKLTLGVHELESLPASEREREREVRRLIREEAQRPFDLARGPLLRSTLLKLKADEYVLLLTMHHIISDGWSLGVFVKELAAIYEAFDSDLASPLDDPPVQYLDFAYWQRQWMRDEVLQAQLDYWKRHLAGAAAVLELPSDRPRPPVKSFRGAVTSLSLPADLSSTLTAFSRREGATLFMVLLAAFKTLLHRYTSQEDIVVGTPIAGRNRVEIEGLIGFFVNTLALRTDLSGDPTFRELLGRVRNEVLDAHAHQDLPLERLIEELHLERDLSRTPLFQIMFALQNAPLSVERLAGLSAEVLEVDSGSAKFDLLLSVSEQASGLMLNAEYCTELFDEASIRRLLAHYERLLRAVVADATVRLSELELLSEEERHLQLVEWNDTAAEFPRDGTIHELIEEQVERSPQAVAVVSESESLSYQKLNERANKVARYLRKVGVRADERVGVLMERSVEMVVGLLGVMKAGGCYVPLDPSYPQERLAFMMEDARVPVLLTQEHLLEVIGARSGMEVIAVDAEWGEIERESGEKVGRIAEAENLAYVIYTSGSTGRPKGAMNTHRALVNRLVWMQEAYRLTLSDRVLQKTPFSFDVSVWELFWPLMVGARLIVARPGGHQEPAYLVRLIQEQEITTLHFVPSMLAAFLAEEDAWRCARSLRLVVSSGEALSLSLQERFFARLGAVRLENLYGPTEAAIDVTSWSCEPNGSQRSVPIGRAIMNTQTYVLDNWMRPVVPGVIGELYLGGVGLARGYLNRPELTAERFIPNAYSSAGGERLYRTGDLVRHLADGNLEYVGRTDAQVKVRGFRIELGEIETALASHEEVREAAVVARKDADGQSQLVAYVSVADSVTASVTQWRNYLRGKLPEHMVPAAFVTLDELPHTTSGKIDRRALPAPDATRPELSNAYVAPATATEETLAGIWQKVLRVERVGVHDDFFELGGHSLLATQMTAKVREAFQIELSLRALFESPTIRRFSEVLERMRRDEAIRPAIAPIPREQYRNPHSLRQLFETPQGTENS